MGMVRFLTIGYGDRDGYERIDPRVRDAAHAHDDRLRAAGAIVGIAGAPVQVRNHDGAGVTAIEGPYLSAALPVAGFGLIDAGSTQEAVAMAAGTPCAVAHGVVEVWPLEEASGAGVAGGSVIVSGWLRVEAADRQAYLDGCRSVIEAARRAPGCLDFHLAADPMEDDRINVYERWADAASVDAFRGAGPDVDQQAMVLDAQVEQHEIAATASLS